MTIDVGRPRHVNCILPPYIVDHMARSRDGAVRRLATEVIESGAAARAVRTTLATMPAMAAIPSPAARKHRLVYDLKHEGMWALPGALVRGEGAGSTKDAAADEAYRHAGEVYEFYQRVYGRNSLDDRGMSLISSVHFLRKHNNAYWNGEQMIYGDGDGEAFIRFTRALDVVGHELSHGVVTHTCNLEYRDEPGALNEHFADVFGVLVRQWKRGETARSADWAIGAACLGPKVEAVGLRTFRAEKAFENDPVLGTDPQPKHMHDQYRGRADYGGVHINSGIPNHAFYRAAYEIGGKAWTHAGRIWYDTLAVLHATSDFDDMVEQTMRVAVRTYGSGSKHSKAVATGWRSVGLL